jgi:hypothetical protein
MYAAPCYKAPQTAREARPWRPCMPGALSPRHRAIRTVALATASYSVFLRLMGPMDLNRIDRVLNKAIWASWPG